MNNRKPLCILRHAASEGPGYFAEVLDRHGLSYTVIAIDGGDPVPADHTLFSGLVFMGGPMSVNDPLPWITQELELIRRAANARLPVAGHCLGGQLISKALGGSVARNPVKELGWLPVQVTPGAAAREWLGGLPERFEAFHWHGERFTIPEGATHLLRSDWCDNQAFVRDNILGMQFHVEMTSSMVRQWAMLFDQEGVRPSASVQSPDQMTSDLEARTRELQRVADTLYARWLKPILAGR